MAITQTEHPYYTRHRATWERTRRMLTGDGAAEALVQRYFEHDEHFRQRKKDADFTFTTWHLLTRLVGMLFQRADDIERDLGPIPDDAVERFGSDGEDYGVVMVEMALTLLTYNECWMVLRPGIGWSVATPLSVPAWDGESVVVMGSRTDGDVMTGIEQQKTWTRYMPQGFKVYIRGEDTDVLIESGTWADAEPVFVDADGRPVPPVLRLAVPWSVPLGSLIARKHRSIFEMESRRDFAVAAAMNGIIQLGVGGDTDLSDAIEDKAKKGSMLWPYDKDLGEHKGLELPTAGAQLGTEILDRKREALVEVAFNALDTAARQSATEAQISHQGGAAAALSVLAETMADAEASILRLWAQALDFRLAGPDPRPIDVSVTWPTDYSDVFQASDLVSALFPSRVPVGVEAATAVVQEYLADHGVTADEEETRAAVQAQIDRQAQAADAGGFFS